MVVGGLEDPLGEFGGELLEGDGLAEVVIHAAFQATLAVRAHGMRRQRNYRDTEAVILLWIVNIKRIIGR